MSRQEAEAIFDAFGKFSERIHEMDRQRREREVLMNRAAARCGNCYHWMKSRSCPIDDQRRGFPHMNYTACGKFEPESDCAAAREALRLPTNESGERNGR